MNHIRKIVKENRQGIPSGVYSVCSAHPLVIEAALLEGKRRHTHILIESTANQVNQFGGYTNMRPGDFVKYVSDIATRVGVAPEKVILGGDHLGPTCWTDEPASSAMEKAKALIAEYVKAGFKKIHLDTSMQCADDHMPLTDEQVAERAAQLCLVAEDTAQALFGQSDLMYVVGTEVPPPGGATEQINTLQATPADRVEHTIQSHMDAFAQIGLQEVWQRVIALVVQPGVEFDNFSVHQFQSDAAQHLSALIRQYSGLVYEAHSTDYQPAAAYQALVKGHFAILKVGPQLTFALREGLFALAHIEQHCVPAQQQSGLLALCERVMLEQPGYWKKFYAGNDSSMTRAFSYSDRIRYYWTNPELQQAIDTLLKNLQMHSVPMPLISQYLPLQYRAITEGQLEIDPRQWLLFHIMQITQAYSQACHPSH